MAVKPTKELTANLCSFVANCELFHNFISHKFIDNKIWRNYKSIDRLIATNV